MLGASISDSSPGIFISPPFLLLSLAASFPIYFLEALSLPTSHEKARMQRVEVGENVFPLAGIRFQNCALAKSFLLESKLLLNGFKMISYPRSHSLSSTPSRATKALFSVLTMRTCGGPWRASPQTMDPQDVLTLNWSHSASSNLSK